MKTLKKIRRFSDFDKEEAWLNDMARKGWRFISRTSLSESYLFEEAVPQSLNLRIDYRLSKSESRRLEYIQIFKDSGWRQLWETNSGYHYFVPARAEASEDIFSDNSSKAERYRRQRRRWIGTSVTVILVPIETVALDMFWDYGYISLRKFSEQYIEFWETSFYGNPTAYYLVALYLWFIVLSGLCLYKAIRAHRKWKQAKGKAM